MNKILLLIFIYINCVFAMKTVEQLNIKRFMGKWYVISAIPNFIEKGCEDAYDIYTLNKDGTISVEYYANKNGKEFNIMQVASILDTINNSKWNMKFIDPWVPFFSAPYDVIILDEENYNYMVIGYPNNDYGWIMCRNTTMNKKNYLQILDVLEKKFNYKIEQFKKIIHNNN